MQKNSCTKIFTEADRAEWRRLADLVEANELCYHSDPCTWAKFKELENRSAMRYKTSFL